MAASTDIKWFRYTNKGAPQVTNNWGVIIPVLDACLVSGFSEQVVIDVSITGKTVNLTGVISHTSANVLVGRTSISWSDNYYKGHMKDLILINGYCEYTSSFDLPTNSEFIRKWDIIDLNYLSKYEVSSAWQSQAFLLYKQNFTVKEISLTLSKQYTTVYNALRRGGYLE